ncbi:MAG: glycosyltransferase [Agriterribacter sp.]
MNKTVHIVCLQVPYPPDYGGVVDLFWKLKYLHELGVTIHLHCFAYGRGQQNELLQYCATVQYYKRIRGLAALRWNIPYIVSSRISKALESALIGDNYPILLEGIHCTWLLHKGILKNRKVILRLHNIEWDYYRQLAQAETNIVKRWYYRWESRLLQQYEPLVTARATTALAVSEKDRTWWQQHHINHVQFLPVFLPWNAVVSKTGKGDYCLYHGNLGVAENEKAALWLLHSVFAALPGIRFIIAGKNPSQRLSAAVALHNDVTLIANPSSTEMEQLIAEAHIHLLPSFTNSGIKLKLLHALFCGRFCVVNPEMVQGTGLEEICIVANAAPDFINAIIQCFGDEFSSLHIKERQQRLLLCFDNREHARMLVEML